MTPGRTWYSVTCISCNPVQSREFDTKREQVAWASTHSEATGHGVRFGRTTVPPTNRPSANCAVCVHLGTNTPATHSAYGTLACEAHVVPMQIAGARGFANAADRLYLAASIARATRPLGKQED